MQEDEKIEEYVILGEEKKNWKEKLIGFLNGKYFIPVIIVLIAIIAFSLGRISGLQNKRPPVRIISENSGEVKGASIDGTFQTNSVSASANQSGQAQSSSETIAGAVVASKNGTKYHYPWCAGAKQISEKNLITFDSIESARTAGYTPASNCKGLK
mgnify:CR=1 FL=1